MMDRLKNPVPVPVALEKSDILLHLFSFLDPISLGNCAQVNKLWYNIIIKDYDKSIWSGHCINKCGLTECELKDAKRSCMDIVKDNYKRRKKKEKLIDDGILYGEDISGLTAVDWGEIVEAYQQQ
ncbi:uncharacterized protein LOC141911404 [Tubulanus polymorphus]|uniref:uncharacterized protein LOC141911404 n=1 Tax=Tubulanus polymorphus TaxID=672921 RepID=UPI003DA6B535